MRRRTRRNPDDTATLLLAAALIGGGYLWWKSRQATTTPGEDTNYASGNVLGVDTSAASGVNAYTSHPSGHGQQYV